MIDISLEEELKQKGICVSTTVGYSMFPMLRDRKDTVILIPVGEQKLQKYDLPLYRRPSGHYVLHRILKVKEDGYVMCGDNQWIKEDPVPHGWVIGVVKGFYREETYVDVGNKWYRAYVHIWCDLFLARKLFLRSKGYVGSIRRKLRR